MLGLRDVVVFTPPPSSDHHPNIPFPSSSSAAALGVGLGIFPFLAAAPTDDSPDTNGASFWKSLRRNPEPKQDAAAAVSGGAISSGSISLRPCEDCGNKAKRDCSFRRCRTCCKSRGYDCSTHVKSTWVPAAVRRERQVKVAIGGSFSTGSSSGANKRTRIAVSSQNATSASHTSTSNNTASTTPRSFNTGSYHQDAGFKETLPGHVNAPAVFRCIRVTAMNEEEAEFAYQATVTISGHVFKGFLYYQGVDDDKNAIPCISELHVDNSGRVGNVNSSSPPIADPSDAFGSSDGTGMLLKGSINLISNSMQKLCDS